MSESTVLILMPVWNESKNLDRLISVIRSQTHSNFLLVIQDNKSQDDTLKIARHHQTQDYRIHVFANEVAVSGGENWFSMISKVQNLDKFDYCCFQAGDDTWGNEEYLANLVKLLECNPSLGAVTPIFKIVNPMYEELKAIDIELDAKYATMRIWKLCRNWDNVHQIYGLYRRDAFLFLLNSRVSKFTDYSGSDWWWTYEFVSRYRSIACKESIYLKMLDPVAETALIPVYQGRLLSYVRAILTTCKPTSIHLSRLREIRSNFHLTAIPLAYFTYTALVKLGVMHFGIIKRRFLSKRGL